MTPELGYFSLIIALAFALLQMLAPIYQNIHKSSFPLYFTLSKAALFGQFIFLSFSMLCLIASFLLNDMTVVYVREHSHLSLPFIYRLGAAWGGHEGSLLLWCLILSGWSLAFTLFVDKDLAKSHVQHSLMILGLISSGFILFLILTSNPFLRLFPTEPIAGEDLTPILQDPGLIFHPPMLYLGYVGFAIGFALAMSALIEGKLDAAWSKACRPWVMLPWAFLSGGIVLGSWWAYRELGWGGFWFWDPVENASLLPWLSATAFLHSLIVSEKRDAFKGWTILLAIISFALSLIGTFLVRSGVLVSVHAFANDPQRGLFLLIYLSTIIGSAFFYYAYRIRHLYTPPRFSLLSRETLLLTNSIILLTAVFTILLGTLYPILLDALHYAKISVGEPYFNTVFLPIILPLLLLMGFAPHVKWGQQTAKILLKKSRWVLLTSFLLAIFIPLILGWPLKTLAVVGLFLSTWIILSTLQYTMPLRQIKLKQASMITAHLGMAILALGVTINQSYSEEKQLKIFPKDKILFAGYQITFQEIAEASGPNYQSIAATFRVQKNNSRREYVTAEQRIYTSHEQTLSKPGILFNVWRDIYIALGNPLEDNAWSVRFYYKPLVRWIWAGGFLMMLGGLFSLLTSFRGRKSNA